MVFYGVVRTPYDWKGLRSSFPFLLLCCFVFIFVCFFVVGVISLFNHWFCHLLFCFWFCCFGLFCFVLFLFCFVLFFLKYVFFYRPISFKIFMRISLFKFIFPLHTKLIWMDKWKCAWIVPFFFLILMIKYFVLFCLFFRRSLPTQNPGPKPTNLCRSITPKKRKKKENTKKKDINKETSQ